jgi:hypothetical protein
VALFVEQQNRCRVRSEDRVDPLQESVEQSLELEMSERSIGDLLEVVGDRCRRFTGLVERRVAGRAQAAGW